MKIKYPLQIIFFLSFIELIGCAKSPSDKEILKAVYDRNYSPKSSYLGVVLDMKVVNKKSSVNNGNKTAFPVTVNTEHVRLGLSYGYTGLGPGQYDKCYEENETIEYLLVKNEWDEWSVESSRFVDKKPTIETWKKSGLKIEDFYKDKIKIKF